MYLPSTIPTKYSFLVLVTVMVDIAAELSIRYHKTEASGRRFAQYSSIRIPHGTGIGAHNDTIDQFIERLVLNGYNGKLRPGLETDTPTFVKVSVHILGFSTIDQINMDYSVNMYLRSVWKDERLSYHDYNETLTLNYLIDSIWTPDIYFINEKEGYSHTITQPNRLMRLEPDGTISYSQKLTVKLACFMKLHSFPHDNQTCGMKLESYGYTFRELVFEWMEGGAALEFSSDMELPEFHMKHHEFGYCTRIYFTGNFSCLYAEFHLMRLSGYYVIQTYVPSVLIVILSWISFWIDHRAIPARISLGLLTVLSITTMSSGALSQLPRVSYVKAIDIWLATCLTFVFSGLIEFAIANFVARMELDRQLCQQQKAQGCKDDDDNIFHLKPLMDRNKVDSLPLDVTHYSDSELKERHRGNSSKDSCPQPMDGHVVVRPPKAQRNRLLYFRSSAERIDYVSRMLFPLTFVLFNAAYWLYYLPH